MTDLVQTWVSQAKAGDKNSLEALVKHIQNRIYGMSLRMLYHPDEAGDATQEILIKVITHLNGFREQGSFTSWALKIAANHLLDVRRSRGRASMTFKEMASHIMENHAPPWNELESQPMRNLIVEEFRIACLQVVLLGLNRPHRLAYILGAVFDVTGREGGEILGIRSDTFRKRLHRARTRINDFMLNHCALIRPGNPCLCERQADYFLSTGQTRNDTFVFADHPCHVRHDPVTLDRLREMDDLARINTLFKTHPGFQAPGTFVAHLRHLVDSDRFAVLRGTAIRTMQRSSYE